MDSRLAAFERITRTAFQFTAGRAEATREDTHPFDERNVHPALVPHVQELFDDGHYSQATFEAFKFVDKEVQRYAKSTESGYKLMMGAFSVTSPLIKLTALTTPSEKDEQKGYQFIFAGAVMAIRNPRGHEILADDPDACLDHLSLASHLLRRMNDAGFK